MSRTESSTALWRPATTATIMHWNHTSASAFGTGDSSLPFSYARWEFHGAVWERQWDCYVGVGGIENKNH